MKKTKWAFVSLMIMGALSQSYAKTLDIGAMTCRALYDPVPIPALRISPLDEVHYYSLRGTRSGAADAEIFRRSAMADAEQRRQAWLEEARAKQAYAREEMPGYVMRYMQALENVCENKKATNNEKKSCLLQKIQTVPNIGESFDGHENMHETIQKGIDTYCYYNIDSKIEEAIVSVFNDLDRIYNK